MLKMTSSGYNSVSFFPTCIIFSNTALFSHQFNSIAYILYIIITYYAIIYVFCLFSAIYKT